VPVCVTRSSNNYGPGQHPEKMIPRSVTSLLKGGKITLHGRGEHVRNWLHVEDNCAAIELVLRGGTPGEVYNIAGATELANRDLAALLLDACGAPPDQVEYVPDRRANDLRYSMTCEKVTDLGWAPQRRFAEALAQTVEWYRDNPGRWAPLLRNRQARLPRISLTTVSEAAS
jgi:dTDP-glucose 4,6-dehydratase